MKWLYQLMFTLNGRLSRKHFWGYHIGSAALLTPLITGTVQLAKAGNPAAPWLTLFCAVMGLLAIASSIAVGVKRLHDLNKSGAYYLIMLIPYMGLAWQFVYLGFFPGTKGYNRFGNASHN